MKILLAPDKFKDSLSAIDVCRAMAEGIGKNHESRSFPLADGGEGTSEILTYQSKGEKKIISVNDPLFRKIKTSYGISGDKKTAFIEMAKASGLELLSLEERNCMYTTTFGTGEMILDAIKNGVEEIILGIGGSATNDAGIGMASALGYKFYDEDDREVKPVGEQLARIHRISKEGLLFDPSKIITRVACDVTNPLYGKKGAAFTYSAQKGASPKEAVLLDHGLRNISALIKKDLNVDVSQTPGAGAAGGMGAGAMAFLNAELIPGIDLVMNYTGFEKEMEKYDLILTGEGRIDLQSLDGKVLKGLTARAKKRKIPVIAICGTLELSPEKCVELGLNGAFSIITAPVSLKEALAKTPELISSVTANILAAFLAGRSSKK